MAAYQRVQKLAGERWSELREEMLAHLRQAPEYFSAQARVDIFLQEGLLDDAIAAVEKGRSYGLIERVMDAVLEHRPDWVIQAARQQAERIIEAGQSKYYHHAVDCGWRGPALPTGRRVARLSGRRICARSARATVASTS